MKNLKDISRVYLIGIGGIGMSALARYFRQKGAVVSGYDKTETILTRQLAAEGINIHYDDSIETVDSLADLIIYTPAIPKDHAGFNYVIQEGLPILKRSEVLGMLTKDSFSICVAGTHGKTTTSAMIAHILRDSGFGCNAFLGGISTNYETNFWSSDNNVNVIEADEYDRSFLRLLPDIAVITSIDADHLDIYGTHENLQRSFIKFSHKIKDGGVLFSKSGLKHQNEFVADSKLTYGIEERDADINGRNIQVSEGRYSFEVQNGKEVLCGLELHMGGRHNIENAIAAIAVAHKLGITDDAIRSAINSFRGVKRRFEFVIRNKNQVLIDDYAHHPEELKALIISARELYPDMHCTVVFQPHLYSRTKDFAVGFAAALSLADEILLLPIYPARELPIDGVSSEIISGKINKNSVSVYDDQELLQELGKRHPQLLIICGAGDIDTLVQPIKKLLEKNIRLEI